MGWTGRYLDSCPKGQERIMEAIKQEGYNFCEADRRSRVIGCALVGNTVYLAVKYDSEIEHCVYGTVILTAYNKKRGEFLTKGMSESMVPCSYDCPKRILDMLTPTEDECSNEWRKLCAEKRKSKAERRRDDELQKLPYGTQIRLLGSDGGRDFNGVIVTVSHRNNRRAFIDWKNMYKYSKPLVEKVGWEIVERKEV